MGAACSSEDKDEVGSIVVSEEQKLQEEQAQREQELREKELREEQERQLAEQKKRKAEQDRKIAEEEAESRRQRELQATLKNQEAEQRRVKEELERARIEAEAAEKRAAEEKRKEDEALKAAQEKERKEREEAKAKDRAQMNTWLRKHKSSNGKVNEKLITRTVPSKKFSFPLHLAVKENNPEIVRILLENEADPNAKSSSGKTPLEKAKQKNVNKSHEKVVKQLSSRVAQGAAA